MDEITETWIALARAHAHVLAGVETALKTAGLPPLAWYDVLWEMARAAPDPLRAKDLEPRLLLPQYGLSRLLTRIAAAGLITRTPDPDDGRGHLLTLTETGHQTRADMWPVYATALQNGFGSDIGPPQLARLRRILTRINPPMG